MSQVPNTLKYTKSHEWVKLESDNVVIVGITEHAQELLGELVFVEIPELGKVLAQGAEAAVVESVKAAADVYSPVNGKVVAVNEELSQSPELINQSPYDKGWIFKIELENKNDLNALLDAEAYQASLT